MSPLHFVHIISVCGYIIGPHMYQYVLASQHDSRYFFVLLSFQEIAPPSAS